MKRSKSIYLILLLFVIQKVACAQYNVGNDNGFSFNCYVQANCPTDTLTQNPIICQGDSMVVGTSVYNTTGTFIDTLTNILGCDSIITTNLTVNSTTTSIDTQTACDSLTWIDGNTYSTSTNTPTDTIVGGAVNGCDSVITLNLTITTSTTTTNVYNECEGFSITVGINTYTITGIYTDIVNNCDTIVTDLTINAAPQLTLIKADDNCSKHIGSVIAITSSNNPPITYFWNTGSTDSIISNLPAGMYSVTVNDASGCAKTETINIDDLEIDCEYFVYLPNAFTPNGDGNNDIFFVRGKGIETISVQLYNRWGNKVFEINDLNQGWDGTYKGSKQNTAVFVYVLEATFLNGKTIKESGDLELIR